MFLVFMRGDVYTVICVLSHNRNQNVIVSPPNIPVSNLNKLLSQLPGKDVCLWKCSLKYFLITASIK